MAVESLLKHVPAASLYYRVAVPDSENALGPWREAATRFVEPVGDEAAWNERFKNRAWSLPEGDNGRRVREIVAANRHALELIDIGIERGRLQYPECRSVEDFSAFLGWLPYLHVVHLYQARAIVSIADGGFHEAGRDLLRMLRFGELLCTGDGFPSEYLSGLAIQDEAVQSMERFAGLPGVPQNVRVEMASGLRHSLVQPNAMAQSVRFDFRFYLLGLELLPDTRDLEALADAWANKIGNCLRRRDFVRVLEGHPRPFDKIATARLSGEEVADTAFLLEGPDRPWWRSLARIGIRWRRWRRRRRLKRQTAPWLAGPSIGELSRMFLNDPELARKVHEVGPDCLERKPPTDEEIIAANRRLRRVDNPLGLLLLTESMGVDWVLFHRQHQRRALRSKRELLSSLA